MNVINGGAFSQASTNAYALIAGSILDATMALSVSFTIKNTGANTILWEVIAGNAPDLSDGAVIVAPATLAANAVASYGVTPAPYSYYGIYIKSNVDNNSGTASIRSAAKG
jgi:uncharacterized membrane protein